MLFAVLGLTWGEIIVMGAIAGVLCLSAIGFVVLTWAVIWYCLRKPPQPQIIAPCDDEPAPPKGFASKAPFAPKRNGLPQK